MITHRQIIFALLLQLSLLPPSLTLSADDSAYKPDPGPLQFKTVTRLSLTDAKRNKELLLRINYPTGDGPFPVIVFSHGAGGSKDNYQPIIEHWVSHSYVTIQPTHSDSRSLMAKKTDPVNFRDWPSRPADISFIIDSLAELETREPALRGRLDAKHIGVGGHSYGANTAQLIGGAKTYGLGAQEKSFADDRASAVMLLSGQGPGEMLRENSWAVFTKPLFVMTGSADGPTRTGQPAVWRKKPYELSPPGDKFLVWVADLDHGFGGITGVKLNPKNKPNLDHVRYTKIATLAFWDAYLKSDQTARAYLESDKLPAHSKGTVHVEHK